jgi:hypothetical protein
MKSPLIHLSIIPIVGFIILTSLTTACGTERNNEHRINKANTTQINSNQQPNNVSLNADVTVTINRNSPAMISQFAPSLALSDDSLTTGNPDASARAQNLISDGIHYVDTPIMGWGLDDPWPDPSSPEPTNWKALDERLQTIESTGATPVLTLSEAPWWMKGYRNPDGTTTTIGRDQEWSEAAYNARVLDDKMDAWILLVRRVAERYMGPPYNIHYFVVWNELKGYFNTVTNKWDYDNSRGNPGGPNAMHGYTYMYNLVYNTLLDVATKKGIDNQTVQIGGPYVVLDTWAYGQSNPSNIVRPYGTFDQRSLDAIMYWLHYKAGASFIAVDGADVNKDYGILTDPFVASEKLADTVHWLHSLDNTRYPGATTLPIWLSEWYAFPYGDLRNLNYNNAIKTSAMVGFIQAGGSAAFLWGGTGDGTPSSGLWTPLEVGGGKPLPWYVSYKLLGDYFGAGTPLFSTTISSGHTIAVLVSDKHTLLVNQTDRILTVAIEGIVYQLGAYEVKLVK